MVIKKIKSVWQRLTGSAPPIVRVLRLQGAIGIRTGLNRGVSLAGVGDSIARLFADDTISAAAIVINSPGGAPVQAALIHDRIRTLATEKGIMVLSFCEDVAASGGYMLALAGDEIYAHENSIIGSIGVVSAGFGFQNLLEKIGVERRVHTAGERKAMLDPFKPEDPKDAAHLEALQREVHESFKAMVRERRGKRLNGENPDLFSGMFWTGQKAKQLGLVDGIGDVRSVARKKFGDEVELELIQPRRPWWGSEKTSIAAPEISAGFAAGLISAAEERSLWARFGL